MLREFVANKNLTLKNAKGSPSGLSERIGDSNFSISKITTKL